MSQGIITYVSNELVDNKNGYGIVKNSSGLLYGLVDISGTQILDFKYDELEFLDVEGKELQAKYEGAYGVVDYSGKEIIPFEKGTFRVINGELIIREHEIEVSSYGQLTTSNHDEQGFDIYNLDGKQLGEYNTYQVHPASGEFGLLEYKDIGGDVFAVSASANSGQTA